MEELAACLTYEPDKDLRNSMSLSEIEDLDWTEQMQLKHIKEKGSHMLNHILTALSENYLRDFFP